MAWSASRPLAARLAASTAAAPSLPPRSSRIDFLEAARAHVDPPHWYEPTLDDGSLRDPVIATPQNTTLVVAVAVLKRGAAPADPLRVLLVREDDGSAEWFLPSDVVAPGESLERTARRVLQTHGIRAEPDALVGVEHYPNGRHQWARVTVEARLLVDDESGPSAAGSATWYDCAELERNESGVTLSGRDFISLVSGQVRVPLVASSPGSRVGFPCHLVQVAVLCEDAVALLELADGRWALPVSHLDVGENSGFCASRQVRGRLGLVCDPAGVLRVDYDGRAELGLSGFRVTVLATVKSLVPDRGFQGPAARHRWVKRDELAAVPLASDDDRRMLLAALEAASSQSAAAVPLIQLTLSAHQQ